MFVGRRMTRKVITVTPEDTVEKAGDLLKRHRIHHLPVVSGEECVGIVTGSDIRNSALERPPRHDRDQGGMTAMRVGEIMSADVVTASPWDTIEDALLVVHRRRFGALPVVEDGKLVGIISKADILAAFIDTLGIEGIGVRIEVVLPQRTEPLAKLITTLGNMELEVRSLILSPFRGEFIAFVRVSTIDVASVKRGLREAGFSVPELADFLG